MEQPLTHARMPTFVIGLNVSMTLLLLLVAFAIYFPVYGFDFIGFDDNLYFSDNRAVRRGVGLEEIWTSPQMPDGSTNWPLVFTSYWLEYRLWPQNQYSMGLHIDNAILHVLGALLLRWWLQRLTHNAFIAWTVAFGFLCHPVQAMSVAWITERKNVLSGVFFFGALGMHVASRQRPGVLRYWGYVLLVLGSLLSKSSTVPLPLLALALDYWVLRRPWSWELLRRQIVPLLLVAGECCLTIYAESFQLERRILPFPQRLVMSTSVMLRYLDILVLPIENTLFYPTWSIDTSLWRNWLPAGVWLVVAGVLLLIRRRLSGIVAFAIGYFFVMTAPISGIHYFGYLRISYVSDHLIYLPMLGFCLLLAVGLDAVRRWGPNWSRGVLVLTAAVLLAWSARCHQTLWAWRNSAALYAPIEFERFSYGANLSKAMWLSSNGKTANDATKYFTAIMQRWPAEAETCRRFSHVYVVYGQLQAARDLLDEGKRKFPNNFMILLGSGDLYLRQDQHALAIEDFLQAVAIQPQADVYRQLAVAFAEMGRFEESLRAFDQSMNLDPFDHLCYYNLAYVLRQMGYRDGAIGALHKALRLEPNDPGARNALKDMLREGNQPPPQRKDSS